MAVAADSAFHVTKGILVDLPHAVVDHEQIQFPVIVVIEPAGAYRPHLFAIHLCAREASSSCDIGERTIAVVVEELIRGYVREKNVGASIIVDRKSTRLNSSHSQISYAVFCLKKKRTKSLP